MFQWGVCPQPPPPSPQLLFPSLPPSQLPPQRFSDFLSNLRGFFIIQSFQRFEFSQVVLFSFFFFFFFFLLVFFFQARFFCCPWHLVWKWCVCTAAPLYILGRSFWLFTVCLSTLSEFSVQSLYGRFTPNKQRKEKKLSTQLGLDQWLVYLLKSWYLALSAVYVLLLFERKVADNSPQSANIIVLIPVITKCFCFRGHSPTIQKGEHSLFLSISLNPHPRQD